MKYLLLSCLVLPTASCEPKAQEAKETADVKEAPATEALATPMARDVNRICNAEELSGALDLQPAERAMHTGIWLAQNLESQDARDLSAELTKLNPQERVSRLQQVATEHGISPCEILHAWRGGE
jgi:hypothetical protein